MLWLCRGNVEGAGSVEEGCASLCKAIVAGDGDGVGENVLSAAFCRNVVDDLNAKKLPAQMVAKVADCCRSKHPRASCF